MPRWTKEQQEAIDKECTNIIVSAGAGSGKTAVLSERVLRKLKDGVNVNELLILTFTKAAAFEMKERIRKKIAGEEALSKQLEYIDSSYITTFDSYALSVVKKYHYLLNLSKEVSIIDDSVIYLEKKKIIDKIFEKLYQVKEPLFLKLINDFCVKDDEEIKKYIISISSKLDLKYDKKEYLDNYLDCFFDEVKIQKDVILFTTLIKNKILNINDYLKQIESFVDSDYLDSLYSVLSNLLNSNNYNDILSCFPIKLPNLPRGIEEDAKIIKEQINNALKEINGLITFENEDEIRSSILLTKDYIEIIIKIILELDEELNAFKYQNNLFEFTDISKMAIQILKENEDVREELKYYFKEIMVDEYQDTSDLQEEFISMIENNNVYMVGDIKQSIYRFRNANPYIFKNKYDKYSSLEGGYKIDLVKNFRSREEVLSNINLVFNLIMDDDIGGANYKETHQMVFGNTSYIEKGSTNQDNNFEILNYTYDKDMEFTKEEIEIFAIAKDIKEKIDNKYQVFDKDEGVLRDITYNDFVILMDRTSKFDLYKKIFGYLQIPLTKYTDTSITNEMDTLIIKNIVSLIINTYYKKYETDFKYSFTSIARSYLFSYTDQEIFDYLSNNNFDSSSIMDIVNGIVEEFDILTPRTLLEKIIDKFEIYSKLPLVGDISSRMIRYEYLINLSSGLSDIGYTIEEFYNYLNTLIEDNYDIKVSMSDNNSDSVKIMTIHKSKGLEYHICYYSGLYAKFNIGDLKEKFLFDNKYGIISPYFSEGISNTIYKHLLKNDYIKEEISEKIRLFYVALTRAKEKMILIASLEENNNYIENTVDNNLREGYRSFLDILKSIYPVIKDYIKTINIEELGLSKEYNLIKKSNYQEHINKTKETINFTCLDIPNKEVEKKHYSKTISTIVDTKTKENLEFGKYMHYLLEVIDFKNPILDKIAPEYRNSIESFLKCGLDFKTCKIYKEYEFISGEHHGVIDLLLEYRDRVIIVDYKLKNIDEHKYFEQLNGYKTYVYNKLHKPVIIYLYSIVDGKIKEIKDELSKNS
ncbi:MAG: UvrD-helicase domain-containing protein [Bacilli bacterium]|nr:UvrD-helicase domain-containing protein [Bacilli bacterium]